MFSTLTDKEIREKWSLGGFENEQELFLFRQELVNRGFVSWDEINTNFVCEVLE